MSHIIPIKNFEIECSKVDTDLQIRIKINNSHSIIVEKPINFCYTVPERLEEIVKGNDENLFFKNGVVFKVTKDTFQYSLKDFITINFENNSSIRNCLRYFIDQVKKELQEHQSEPRGSEPPSFETQKNEITVIKEAFEKLKEYEKPIANKVVDEIVKEIVHEAADEGTILQYIIEAIYYLGDTTGSSLQAIEKYITRRHGFVERSKISDGIKFGLQEGKIATHAKHKRSYILWGSSPILRQ